MHWRSSFILLLSAPRLAFTQAASSQTTTASASATTYAVQVGAEGLLFTPSSLTAAVGDIIEFRFYPQNHSVARAGYKTPCYPYEFTGAGKKGFWSGFRPTNVVSSNPPSFQVRVNDTEPIFFYCSAPGACNEDEMVGVVNPTLETQKAFAKNATIHFSPGEGFPAEVASTTSTSSTSSTSSSSPTSSTTTQTPTSTPTSAPVSKPTLSTGAIAGIAIGGAAVAILAAALLYLCGRQRTMGEILQQAQQGHAPPSFAAGSRHLSMASSPGYMSKMPHLEVEPLGMNRYSGQGGFYERSTETESYRSRSPPVDEAREHMIPNMYLNNPPGNPSPARASSPPIRRPVPQNAMSPLSPEDPDYQTVASDIPQSLRVARQNPQQGLHELSVESDRKYLPYQSPEFPRENSNNALGPGGS